MIGDNLAPSLGKNYIAYNNSIRLDLRELGIDKRQADNVLTPLQIAAKFDKEEAEKEKEKT